MLTSETAQHLNFFLLLHETQTVLEKQVWLQTAQVCLVCFVVFS